MLDEDEITQLLVLFYRLKADHNIVRSIQKDKKIQIIQ